MKAVALALLTAASQPTQQFDLVCTGQWRFDISAAFEEHDFRLRVDLDKKLWCEGDCKALKPIAEVQPAFIAFEPDQTREEQAHGDLHMHYVDRETGKFTYFSDGRTGFAEQKAQCERAPFSGFPKIETKF